MLEDKEAWIGGRDCCALEFCPRAIAPGVADPVKKVTPGFLSEAEKANKRQQDVDKLALAAQDAAQPAAAAPV